MSIQRLALCLTVSFALYGQGERGTLGPYLPNVRDRYSMAEDIGLQKAFKFNEQRYAELRATFLNPFNRHGVGGLITNITDPNFGQFTGQQTGPRNIELALRLVF